MLVKLTQRAPNHLRNGGSQPQVKEQSFSPKNMYFKLYNFQLIDKDIFIFRKLSGEPFTWTGKP